jgi:zinc/manganese transport system permease protein
MEVAGAQRPRGRDLATGIVLGAALGLAALLIYLESVSGSATGEAATILFGSLFYLTKATLPFVAVLGGVALAAVAVCYRPLMLTSVAPELAAARGIPVRMVGVLYLATLAVCVALAAVTIGTILSTAVLIGPAATALRLTRRPGRAMALAAAIGIGSIWLGIVLAYDSFDWPPAGHAWPVSFFVVTAIVVCYLLAGASRRAGR